MGLANQKDLVWPVNYSEQSKINYCRLEALVKLATNKGSASC